MADSKFQSFEQIIEEPLKPNSKIWKLAYDSVKEIIQNWFSQIVANMGYPGQLVRTISMFVNIITGTLIAVLAMVKTGTGYMLKFISGVNLISMGSLLISILTDKYADFKETNAREEMLEFLESMPFFEVDEIIDNSAKDITCLFSDNLGKILTVFFSIIITGFGLCTKGVKGITDTFRMVTSVKTGYASIKGVVEGALSELVAESYDPAHEEKKQLTMQITEIQEILRKSLGSLVKDNRQRARLKTLLSEANKSLMVFHHVESNGLRSLLAALTKDLNKKIEELEQLPIERQVTTGVFLMGAKGVGKSALVSYLSSKLSKEFNIDERIYNVTPGIRFYEPYLNEEFGICNEFNSAVEKNQFVLDANKICSSDPFNFESAALNSKVASCQLKTLFVTSNTTSPAIAELKDFAIPAFWDRFIILEVKDPLVQPRRNLNLHRKKDFSHLKFDIKEVVGNDSDVLHFKVLYENTSVDNIYELIATKMALEQIRFMERLDIPRTEKEQKELEIRAKPKPGSLSFEYFGFVEEVIPNDTGRNFPMIRIQGVEGTGKTSTARKVANLWLKLTTNVDGEQGYFVQESSSIKDFKPNKNKPGFYILDDWVSAQMKPLQVTMFLTKMNTTHKASVFVLTTNEVIKSLPSHKDKAGKFWSLLQGVSHRSPYDVTRYKKVYSGILRRIGLDFPYYNGEFVVSPPSASYNITVTVSNAGMYEVNGKSRTPLSLLNDLKEKFVKSQNDRYNVIVLNEKPEVELEAVDFELKVDNKEILFRKLSTSMGTSSLYLAPTSSANLNVSNRILKGFGATGDTVSIKPSDFLCKEIFDDNEPIDDRYMSVVSRIARVLQRYFEDSSFRVTIKEEKQTFYCEKNIIYYYNEEEHERLVFKEGKMIFINGSEREISSEDLAMALTETRPECMFTNGFKEFSARDLQTLRTLFMKLVREGSREHFVLEVLNNIENIKLRNSPVYKKALSSAKDNKVLMLALGGVATIVTAGAFIGVVKLVMKLFKKETNGEEIQDNAFANVGSTPPKRKMQSEAKSDKIGLGTRISKNFEADQWVESMTQHYKQTALQPPVYKEIRSEVSEEVIEEERNPELELNGSDKQTDKEDEMIEVQTSENSYIVAKKNRLRNIIPNSPINVKKQYFSRVYPNYNMMFKVKKPHELPHEHVCKACKALFVHQHFHDPNVRHPQYSRQCPNILCSQFMGKENDKNALLIQLNFPETRNQVATPNSIANLLASGHSCLATHLKMMIAGMEEETRKRIFEITSNTQLNQEHMLHAVTKEFPEFKELLGEVVVANMLSIADMIDSEESSLEVLHRKLNRSYVCLHHAESMAYALHLGNGQFLTVSHSFNEVGEQLGVSSEGVKYPGIVTKIVRERDLAIIYCKNLRCLPSATRYFIGGDSEIPSSAYYLRCGQRFEVIAGSLDYTIYQEFVEGFCNNENFKPTTEVLKIKRIGMNIETVVKKGDCGFPFISQTSEGMKIVGIHNAYKQKSIVYGAYVTRALIEELVDEVLPNSTFTSTAVAVRIPVKNEEGFQTVSMPIEYANAFDESLRPDPIFPGNKDIVSIGYHPLFKNYNPQKEKWVTHELKLTNTNTTLPAAYAMTYVEDTTELDTDRQGFKNPLVTQALKYGELPRDLNEEDFAHAVDMVKDYNEFTYANDGKFRILTEFEALNGMREPFLSNVDITTSAGPYPKYWGKVLLKKEILDVKDETTSPIYSFSNNIIAQNVRNHLKVQKQLLENYFIPPCLISQDNAKVENVEAEEARKGKVRLFNNVDLALNCILKMYFGNWFARAMESSGSGYYSIGQNPYTTSTEIWHRFSTKHGKILNTDFKRFDKKLPAIFIKAFCEIAASLTRSKRISNLGRVYDSLYKTLTHAVHILNGSIYIVNNGNESGTFVTTLLNCVSVHIVFNYTFIKAWKQVPKYMYIKPSLNDVMSRSELAILGDDKTQIVSFDVPMNEDFLIKTAAEMGMWCTPAKGGKDDGNSINFCSRVFAWDSKEQIAYPRLKKSSITGQLYWFSSFSRNQVRDNLMISLFEASLHEEEFYETVLGDAQIVASNFGVDIRTVPFTNYRMARQRLKSMLMNDIQFQQISALENRETNKDLFNANLCKLIKQNLLNTSKIERLSQSSKLQFEEQYKSFKNKDWCVQQTGGANCEFTTQATEVEMAKVGVNNNPISKCLEFISKLGLKAPTEHYERVGPDHQPTYTCSLTYADREFGGEGASKISAKTQAYGALRIYLNENIISNSNDEAQVVQAESQIQKIAVRAFTYFIEQHIATARNNSCGKQNVILVSKRHFDTPMEEISGFHRNFADGNCYVLSPVIAKLPNKKVQACYTRYPGINWDDVTQEVTYNIDENNKTYVLRSIDEPSDEDYDELRPNASNDAVKIGVESDVPVIMPTTSVMDSEKAGYTPLIMNRSAPSNNWLRAGGITFNIFDLVYNQFVGCNKQISISDEATQGTILAQIPYSIVNNEYANSYMQNIALLHGRMTGDWMIKVTCPGNPGMQCSVGFGWSPSKITSKTVAMDVITKYAFFTTGVATEWSQTLVLTDARQSDFYRKIERVSTGVKASEDQPHIVIFCETPATSVFTEKKSTVMTFFSKFCSERDIMLNPAVKPLVLADPQNSVKYDSTKGYTLNF